MEKETEKQDQMLKSRLNLGSGWMWSACVAHYAISCVYVSSFGGVDRLLFVAQCCKYFLVGINSMIDHGFFMSSGKDGGHP